MNFSEIVESVLLEKKKTKKKRKNTIKNKSTAPYGFWGPWGLPGWGSSSDMNSDTGDSGSSSD